MSIHAVTCQTEELILRQRRMTFVSSLAIGVLSVLLFLLLLSLFLLAPMARETPVIVTYESNIAKEAQEQEKKTLVPTERKPSAPSSSSMAKVIVAQTVSVDAVPTVDVDVTTPSLDFGTGDDFGDAWSTGDTGTEGGASFFNQSVKAKRLAYVIDYSLSMSGKRDKLMRAELEKSVSHLAAGMQFQMIFFAGPVWVAGQEVTMKEGRKRATVKDGSREFEWQSGSDAHGWNPVGREQKPEWTQVSAKNLKSAISQIRETRLVWGTIWDHPLEMALSMEPKPQVIFFMTDGIAGGRSAVIAEEIGKKAKRSGVTINTIALMEPKAEGPMKNLAKLSGGQFSIVKEDGSVEIVPFD